MAPWELLLVRVNMLKNAQIRGTTEIKMKQVYDIFRKVETAIVEMLLQKQEEL